MEEIKDLENKIKKDKEKLEEYKSAKFKKNSTLNQREEQRKLRQKYWIELKRIIKLVIKSYELQGKKLSMNMLGKLLGINPKTAKKYYDLILNNKELEYRTSQKPVWNAQVDLRFTVIERTDKHMGRQVVVALSDLIDDVQEDLKPEKPLNYSTVHSWIRNNENFITKYSTKKRKHVLKMIRIISERIEKHKEQLKALKKVKAQNIKDVLVDQTQEFIKKQAIAKIPKEKFMEPGTIIQWDGGQDLLYQNEVINRTQVVDITGYSYATIFTKRETNNAYKQALYTTLKQTRCIAILADKRKGVDPSDIGAEIGGIVRNLNITIIPSSDSNHKALVEKDHGLMRSKVYLDFSKHNVTTLEQARKRSKILNNKFNTKYNYKQPKYNGQRVPKEILDFILWDHKTVLPDSNRFIRFNKNAYELIENGKPVLIDTSDVYVVGQKDNVVKVLFKNKLYQTRLIPKVDLTAKEFANSIIRDKFRKNSMIIMNSESLKFWLESETKSIMNNVNKKLKIKYQDKMTSLFKENIMLKEKLSLSSK